MGSIGKRAAGGGTTIVNNVPITNPTKYNDYGFEIEDTNSPDVEFTDDLWQEMANLRAYGAFTDSELRDDVDDKISQLVNQYGDLAAYDADLTTLREKIDGENITDDEYWAGYQVMAKWLGILPRRYTVWDSQKVPWDDKFTSVAVAEQWADGHDGAYVYDTWLKKYRKIGGKNWRK